MMQNAAMHPGLQEASALFAQGRRPAALRACRQLLERQPAHRDGRVLLGAILLADGNYDEAVRIFSELARDEPDEPTHWSNLGTGRRNAGDLSGALVAYARAAALGADSADFFYNVGLTHIDRLDFEAACAVLGRAASSVGADAEIHYRYAEACNECRRPSQALSALENWREFPGSTAEVLANIGTLLMNLGDTDQALAAFDRVRADDGVSPRSAMIMIEALERMNRLPEARAAMNLLIANPESRTLGEDLLVAEAQLAEREGQLQTAIRLRRQILATVTDFHLRHVQLFRLAKCLDAVGLLDEAFATLTEAHRSQVSYLSLAAPAVNVRGVPTMSVTRYGCAASDVGRWDHSGAPDVLHSPIFIVAFPRSGTTLLELALDAHPLLRSMDEQPFLQLALHELDATGHRYPEEMAALSSAHLEAVRAGYWERVGRKVRLEPGQRLVDKNPLNILRLPAIRRLFPHSPVLFAIRHPCDVLWSCFLQHFRSPDFALLCADLQTLATGYRRTMDFWYEQSALLQGSVREVRYERFVGEFVPQMRELCEFLHLPWDDAVRSPAAHAQGKGFISTPSYSQVVQPVNQKAVGKWQAYRQHLSPILPTLRPYFDRWGYEA